MGGGGRQVLAGVVAGLAWAAAAAAVASPAICERPQDNVQWRIVSGEPGALGHLAGRQGLAAGFLASGHGPLRAAGSGSQDQLLDALSSSGWAAQAEGGGAPGGLVGLDGPASAPLSFEDLLGGLKPDGFDLSPYAQEIDSSYVAPAGHAGVLKHMFPDLLHQPDQDLVARAKALTDPLAVVRTKAGFCTAVHIGGGRFLTNRHCVGSAPALDLLIGEVTFDAAVIQPPDLLCRSPEVEQLPALLVEGRPVRLDAAILRVDPASLGRYRDAFYELSGSRSAWCAGDPSCLTVPDAGLHIVQVWVATAGRTFVLSAGGGGWKAPSGGLRTISEACRTPPGSLSHRLPAADFHAGVCRTPDQPASYDDFGRAHFCNTVKSSSGSPLVTSETVQAVLSGRLPRPALAGLHRSGLASGSELAAAVGIDETVNCAIPSRFIQEAMP